MAWLERFFTTLDGWLGSAIWFPYLLIGVGLFFTLYLKFPQIRFFRHAWQVLRGKYSAKDDPGDTSHFQALSTALSGTVGTGNIGGVALAIFLGGPAALFWMWATAFFGMTTKFVEVSLSHKYRVKDAQGRIAGGPMYYMERGLNMRWLAVFFAVAVVISSFGTGNMPQSNNMAAGLEASFGIPTWISGLVFAVLLGLVIVGGIRRIARVSATIVPFMGIFYAFGALAVVISNFENVVPAFLSVFEHAFTGTAATGGFLGASFAYAFSRGVNRGLFSNEAGQGSAPIAHAAARTEEPVSEGAVAILEPFIDTLIICTLTGMVILASGVWQEKFETVFAPIDTEFVAGTYNDADAGHVEVLFGHLMGHTGARVQRLNAELVAVNGAVPDASFTVIHNRSIAEDVRYLRNGQPYSGPLSVAGGKLATPGIVMRGRSLLHSVPLTVEAFKRSFLGEYGQYAVTIGLVLFAFSTAIAWSYYGDRSMTYLIGAEAVMPYRIVYVIGFFLATVVDTSFIWLVSAVAIALMAIPNLVGLILMHREVRRMTDDYRSKYWSKFQ